MCRVLWACLILLAYGISAQGQTTPAQIDPGTLGNTASASAGVAESEQRSDASEPGSIKGTIVDKTGAPVAGAQVTLTRGDKSPDQHAVSGEQGQFNFERVAPGPFQVVITAQGFATDSSAGTLHAGENLTLSQISLALATAITEVHVSLSTIELAQEQLKEQEQQRVLGLIPNFYVSYVPNAAPLTPKQKFQLAWKTTIDPVSFGITAAVAGIEQGTNQLSGYGQGAQGYAKRYGAAYADSMTGTFIGSAILPSLLKQDPRYFYKGTGTKRSRVLYAIANSVICKGDNGHWEPNYSSILGSLASGGISNLYYPASDRNVAQLTIENTLINIGSTAAANILQEFVIRKLTPNLPNYPPVDP